MAKKMLIVESPAKAKTISKYLNDEFIVKSSYGHVRDLDKGNKGIDKENFEPKYVVSPEKTKVVKELKDTAKKATEVWLATDEDREGEAIAWHLCEVLGLDAQTTKRIVFREITKSAIQNAITEPRTVDLDLVNAQQARRILDRLVGFELSEVLWRKVKNKLSAGRVQSVAVKLIIEREKEIQDFVSTDYYKVYAHFFVSDANGKKVKLRAELKSNIPTLEEAEAFLEKSKGGLYKINDIVVKPSKRKPSAPFTTSTLQQDASRKLGFSVNRTMSTAQRLYEQGLITYMRTDSTSLSKQAIAAMADQIGEKYGEEYVQVRNYTGKKSKGAQEAHEAIRPTNAAVVNAPVKEQDQQKLYSLIWKRAVASQMADAQLENTTVTIGVSTVADAEYVAKGQVIKFDGFLKLYIAGKDEDNEDEESGLLPPLTKGQDMELDYVQAIQRFTRPPSRYTEASLVKKLEELGIGRPSTYAPTITKIMDPNRGYVEKESREGIPRDFKLLTLRSDALTQTVETENTGSTSKRLYGKDIGMVVTDFLDLHFNSVMNYAFTANVEERLDEIAEGKIEWKDMLEKFYDPFHETVEKTIAEAERAKGRRDLGVDEKTGHTILVQMSRYGPVAQIGTREEVGEEGKPKFASLKPGQSMNTINLEEVMELFKLPYELGEYKGKPVEVAQGRFGPYVKYDEMFCSLDRGEDPLTVSMERAQELIDAKIKEQAPVGQFDGMPITKGKGRFGPYLKWNELFINIPKRYDHENLTKAEIDELVEAKKIKEANRFVQQWPELKLAIENGRWGPFIRFKKKSIKLPKINDKRMTSEEAAKMTLEEVKNLVEAELPGSFKEKKKKAPAKKKKPAAKKKAPAKKKAAKK